ncbi:peptide-methionine (R)-S-oxide reductase MsrB [Candidatus Nomurabacteria bacterium]|nr:peptide-methionine (R)-S-oxide reductase MsrB [Candidatus Nomurabacteria bacterium]
MVMIKKTDKEWREELTEEQYRVMRQKGTEIPFSGELTFNKKSGDYTCAACGEILFNSDSKYQSTIPTLAGWPSFAKPIEGSVEYREDDSFGMVRTEVLCANCGSHLGHVFDDSSSPTGSHYCLNSVCLGFNPKDSNSKDS